MMIKDVTNSLKDLNDFWHSSSDIKCFIDDEQVPCTQFQEELDVSKFIRENS